MHIKFGGESSNWDNTNKCANREKENEMKLNQTSPNVLLFPADLLLKNAEIRTDEIEVVKVLHITLSLRVKYLL